MNKTTLRLLLLTGLAVFIYASCSKDKDFPDIPDSFERNKKPFSVEVVPKDPVEGGSITLDRITLQDSVLLSERIDLSDTLTKFHDGDSLVLTATPNNGYTFINWIRNRKEVSTKPVYGFRLDSLDIDELNHVIYHYQARFGLDYAIQSIPSIDKVIPAALINIMGDSSFLYFGDNPPSIDTCFAIPNIPGLDFIMIDTVIKYNPMTSYYRDPQRIEDQRFTLMLLKQHRCIAEKLIYERCYDSIGSMLDKSITADSIFIMGEGKKFTIYYKQKVKFKASEELASFLEYLEELIRYESVIISGIIDENGPGTGITHFHLGVIVDGYSDPTHMAVGNIVPGIKDIILYSYPGTLTYDPIFYLEHLDN